MPPEAPQCPAQLVFGQGAMPQSHKSVTFPPEAHSLLLKVAGERIDVLTLVPFSSAHKGSLEMGRFLKAFLPLLLLLGRGDKLIRLCS